MLDTELTFGLPSCHRGWRNRVLQKPQEPNELGRRYVFVGLCVHFKT